MLTSSIQASDKLGKPWMPCVLPQVALWGKGILCHMQVQTNSFTTCVRLYRLPEC